MQPPVNRFARLLVATDGSPNSDAACEIAAEIASHFGSHVTVMTAVPSSDSGTATAAVPGAAAAAAASPATTAPGPHEDQGRQSKIMAKSQQILERSSSIFQAAGVAVSEKKVARSSSGSTVETIIGFAGEDRSDLIVTGTRGMGSFKRALLGSVSSAVAIHASCATLVVRSKKKEGREGQAQKHISIGSIMVAIDGSENAQRALAAAVSLAKGLGAKLEIVHVVNIPSMLWTLGTPPGATIPVGKVDDEGATARARELMSRAIIYAQGAGVESPKNEVVTDVVSPAQAIVELAEENGVGIIVIGTRGTGGFKKLVMGSVANSVLHYAHCSVMVVK
jgi:nucleotide-binding universal stress UspA family protein